MKCMIIEARLLEYYQLLLYYHDTMFVLSGSVVKSTFEYCTWKHKMVAGETENSAGVFLNSLFRLDCQFS